MKTTRSKGAVLTLVIVALSLMGTVMYVLADGSKSLLFQADTAYCQAVERNLAASAVAWAQERVAAGETVAVRDPVPLDTSPFEAQQATLTVEFTQVNDAAADIRIETSAGKGRQTLARSRAFAIARP